MLNELKKTNRGFGYYEFKDRYGKKCSLQKSSLATEDCIWLGVDDIEPKILSKDAKKLGIETDQDDGWIEYPLPGEVVCSTRMHLSQEQAEILAKYLTTFAKTGEIMV